jgi:sec-independent protein translocase protein TatA
MLGDIIQPTHLLFILVVALLVLGPKRLPEVGRSLGKGIRDFRSAMAGIEEHTTGLLKDEPATQAEPVAASSVRAPVAQTVVSSEPEPGDYAD